MLTAAELNLLNRLDLAYRRPVSGLYAGERRSPRAARSPEFSDFLVEDPWGPPLAALRRRRQEPVLWQLLAPDEEHPSLSGDLKLVEEESSSARELTITPALVHEYLAALAAHRGSLARAAEG